MTLQFKLLFKLHSIGFTPLISALLTELLIAQLGLPGWAIKLELSMRFISRAALGLGGSLHMHIPLFELDVLQIV